MVILCSSDFDRLSDFWCPDFVGTVGLGCCIQPCFLVILASRWELSVICWKGWGLGELWNM